MAPCLHVYNFRDLPHAFIRTGQDSLIGELNVLRGQGGIPIGDRVYTSPLVQILAVDHIYSDPARPFVEQGITAEGIVVEDDVWIGGGVVITDGVRLARAQSLRPVRWSPGMCRPIPSSAASLPACSARSRQAIIRAEPARQIYY